MATSDPAGLARAARRAYELGRLTMALSVAWPAAGMTGLSLLHCGQPEFTAAVGATLCVLCLALPWRHRRYVAPVRDGLWAGAAPGLLALLLATKAPCPMSLACEIALYTAMAGGGVAGLLLGRRSQRVADRRTYAAAALVVAGLTGSLGCVIVGIGGVAGITGGLLVGTAPLLLVPRASRG